MNDRIQLAEVLGKFNFEWNRDRCPEDWDDEQVQKLCRFDPFTDANDDYAVLEWVRGDDTQLGCTNRWEMMMDAIAQAGQEYSIDYKIGDYARAALKVLVTAPRKHEPND